MTSWMAPGLVLCDFHDILGKRREITCQILAAMARISAPGVQTDFGRGPGSRADGLPLIGRLEGKR